MNLSAYYMGEGDSYKELGASRGNPCIRNDPFAIVAFMFGSTAIFLHW